jgi:hypothetical protein
MSKQRKTIKNNGVEIEVNVLGSGKHALLELAELRFDANASEEQKHTFMTTSTDKGYLSYIFWRQLDSFLVFDADGIAGELSIDTLFRDSENGMEVSYFMDALELLSAIQDVDKYSNAGNIQSLRKAVREIVRILKKAW